jgi:agmatine deiminase
MTSAPIELGFRQPAEWDRHRGVWLAWPSHAELWQEALADAQDEFAALCLEIADVDPQTGQLRGDALNILVRSDEDERLARARLDSARPTFHRIAYGDIWLRDTAPIFVVDGSGQLASVRFTFNGWGGKYVLPGDGELSAEVQRASGARSFVRDFVLEGGAVDVDGEGTVLTTKQCLLNPNRNPSMDQAAIERALEETLGVSKVLWLDQGLLNDHTDGHIDTLARFIAPGVVVCMEPSGANDPNREALLQIAAELSEMSDAKGRRLKVVRIPSPGLVTDEDGEVMPASYANFYISNSTVVVPTYGSSFDDAAVAALAPLFPKHRVVGSSARVILEGGGAFHCITQQVPEGAAR